MRAWLQLIRLPNLFTVPGDPLAGAVLATQSAELNASIVLAMIAAVCVYAAGLIWNDYFDLEQDRRERPNRPLPSGQISPLATVMTGHSLALTGWALCLFAGWETAIIGTALILNVFLYNRFLKHISGIAELSMGSCRGLSLLLGVSAGGGFESFSPYALVAASILLIYISTVTHIARSEKKPHHAGAESVFPFIGLIICLLMFWPLLPSGPQRAGFLAAYSITLLLTGGFAIRMVMFTHTSNQELALYRRHQLLAILPRWIGQLVAGLIPLQVAFILYAHVDKQSLTLAAILGLGWMANRWLSRSFYAS